MAGLRLPGKVAVITGAGKGIGRATARLFVAEGAAVVAAVHRATDLPSLERDVDGLPGRLVGVEVDVSRDADARRMIETAVSGFGGLDILVNNAGVEVRGTVDAITDDQWNLVMDTNLRGAFLACRHAIPEMLKRGAGAIVNVSSINGIRGNSELAAYCATKGGLNALTRAMAIDYAARGIRANAVCPASIETQMSRENIASAPDPAARRLALIAKHPMGRIGTPEEVACAILFLASDEASFITGVELPIDGGRSIR
jgi:meso-butanediol dehydrogenase / (S,S)-butanediol dehydrogenase / diacetyl reductase